MDIANLELFRKFIVCYVMSIYEGNQFDPAQKLFKTPFAYNLCYVKRILMNICKITDLINSKFECDGYLLRKVGI